MQSSTELLLLHGGELSDVADLLDELEVEWVQGRAGRSLGGAVPLVIGTPGELLRFEHPGGRDSVARIAICEGGSKTLDRKLEAEGIDFILRRPIHPTALRLLILHLVYRGPERRRLRRVSASVPVRYRMGWRPSRGLLLEFSVGGCGLLTQHPLPSGRVVSITLPDELGLGRKLRIKGRVVRSIPAASGDPGEHVAAIDFGELDPDTHQRLAAAVVARARRAVMPMEAPRARPKPAGTPAAVVAPAEPEDLAERRQLPRGRYTKAIHGRVEGDPVVLMGSNLSPAGMRVEAEPRLIAGNRLKLDLYGHGDIPPLRLEARVARNDGEQGVYLEFTDLWPGAPALIERLIKTLPLVSTGDGEMVISEVVEADTLGDRRG